MGLVGVVIRGALVSIVVLFVGPWPRAVIFGLWTLLLIWIEFHNQMGQWPQHVHPACVIGGLDSLSHPTKLSPQRKCGKICDNPGVP